MQGMRRRHSRAEGGGGVVRVVATNVVGLLRLRQVAPPVQLGPMASCIRVKMVIVICAGDQAISRRAMHNE